ncbi:MAG: P-II family nitrogen regulator [Planctomycetota bacterium]
MKLVTAVLAPERLDAVTAALAGIDVYRMTVTECQGVVRGGSDPDGVGKLKLEIAVNENFVKPTIEAIETAGRLDEEDASGFGKIFVTELLDVVRIRTGERGPDAI